MARRAVRLLAFAGTAAIALAAAAFIVTQTPWFREWARAQAVQIANRYLRADLDIGGLGGNLFTGVELHAMELTLDERAVVTVDRAEVGYNLLELFGGGVPIGSVTLIGLVVHLRRTAEGLNVTRLIEPRPSTGGRGTLIDIGRIEVENGVVTIGERVVTTGGIDVPERLADLDATLSLTRRPGAGVVLDIERLSFQAREPAVQVDAMTGTLTFAKGVVRVEDLTIQTARSTLEADGQFLSGTAPPSVELTVTSPELVLPELARILPALERYEYSPSVQMSAHGPLDAVGVEFRVRTRDGAVSGDVVVDAARPGRSIRGTVHTENLNLAAFAPFDERTSVSADALVDVEVERRRLTFDVDADMFGGIARAKGVVILPAGSDPVQYHVQGAVESLDAGRLPEPARPPFGGAPVQALMADAAPVSFDFSVEGRGSVFDVDLALQKFQFAGARFAPGTDVQVSRRGGRLQYEGRGQVSGLDTGRLGRALGVEILQQPVLDGVISGRFDLGVTTGGGAGPSVEGTATLVDSSLFGTRFPSLDIVTRLRQGDGRVSVEGRFTDLEPGALIGQPQLTGSAAGFIDADAIVHDLGTPGFDWRRDLEVNGRVALDRATLAGVDVTEGAIAARFAEGVVDVRELHLEGDDLGASAEGQLALNRTGQSSLTFTVDTPPLGAVEPLPDPLSGEAIVKGRITGNLLRYRSEGSLSGSNIAYGDYAALSVTGSYALQVPALDFSRATIRTDVDATQVEIGGRVLEQVAVRVGYSSSRLDFDGTAALGDRAIDVAGALRLHADHREVHLAHFAVETRGTRWELPPGNEPAIRYGGSGIAVEDFTIVSTGEGRLSIDGALGPAGAGLTVAARSVPVGLFDDLVLEDRRVTGMLDATATVTGTTASPDVRARFSLVDGAFDDFRFQALGGQVEYAGGSALELDVQLDAARGASLTATGTVPLSSEGAAADDLRLQVTSDPIDLAAVTAFTDEIGSASGTIRIDLLATGSYDDPRLTGTVDINQGAFLVTALQSRYTGLDTTVRFTPALITVPAFAIQDDEGHTMHIAGELGYEQRVAGQVAITIRSDNFEVIDNALAEVDADTSLRLTGEFLRPRLEGRVAIEQGTVRVDEILELLDDGYPTGRSEENAAPPPPVEAGPLDNVALSVDVALVVPESLVLRGTDLHAPGRGAPVGLGDINITIGGDLRFRKEAGAPLRVTGAVQPVRGTYEFQGRQFDILREGQIEFAGLGELNPRIDLIAQRVVAGVEAQVHVGGTLRSPTLELTSNPPLDQADILSLIVFNQPINQLGSGEQISIARRAASLAAGFVTSRLTESIAQALEVDVLELQIGGATLTPMLTVGEQLAQGLFVKLRQQFGVASATSAVLEYQLTDWLRLEGEVSRGGLAERSLLRRVERGGISLLFRFGY